MSTPEIIRHLREANSRRHIDAQIELVNALVDGDVLTEVIALLERRGSRTGVKNERPAAGQLGMMI